MDLRTFEFITKSEHHARLYFKKQCWKKSRVFCTRCHSYQIYQIPGCRYRCKRCGYKFHDFTDRWLNALNISWKQWLWIIKLFELELSTRKLAQQVALSYPTVLKAVQLIRKALVTTSVDRASWLTGEIELDETYFGGNRKGNRGRGATHKIPVFGILERNGIVKVDVVHDVSAASLWHLTVKTVRRGSLVYTDKFRSYDTVMFCGYRHLRIDHQKRFASGKVYINGLEGFWSYAQEHLIKFHGVSPEKFPFYLKEMEFRYNHRDQDLFLLLTEKLCDFVPNLL